MNEFKAHQVSIIVPGMIGSRGRVEIDGEELRGVRRVSFSTGVGELTVVTIEMLTKDLTLTLDADAIAAVESARQESDRI